MKKWLTALALCTTATMGFAQTATELIGKWQLVDYKDPKGKTMNIERELGTTQVFQVFSAPNVFQSILGKDGTRGTWSMSPDNKVLTIKAGLKMNFEIKSFTPTTRVIVTEDKETLTYEKR
jgi:hypothetical protein